VRALAAAVLPWLDPQKALEPLLRAVVDDDARVQAQAVAGLLAIARRLDEPGRRRIQSAAESLLATSSDEVACAAGELLVALDAEAGGQLLRERADKVGAVRYGCWARLAGLPVRRVVVPVVDEPTPPATKDAPAPVPAIATPPQGEWLYVTEGVSAGLFAGAILPSAFAPSRDVLTYTAAHTRLVRQDASLVSQMTSSLGGGALLGGGAFALSRLLGPLDMVEAASVGLGTASGTLTAAGLVQTLHLDAGTGAWVLSASTVASFAATSAVAYGTTLTAHDNAMIAAIASMSALGGGLAAFTFVPVGVDAVGGALRSDFGLGVALAAGGAGGLVALGLAPFVDVTPTRVLAASGGGVLLAAVGVGAGFLFIPSSVDVRSRIACGMGLGGEILGATLGLLLVPDTAVAGVLASMPRGGEAVSVDDGALRIGVPVVQTLAPVAQAPRVVPLAVPLFGARF
jgi:hypothetical protein